jgi:hypothetical protein
VAIPDTLAGPPVGLVGPGLSPGDDAIEHGSALVVGAVPLVVEGVAASTVLHQLDQHLHRVGEGPADDLVLLLTSDLVDPLDELDLLGGGTFRERRMAHAFAPFLVWSFAQ